MSHCGMLHLMQWLGEVWHLDSKEDTDADEELEGGKPGGLHLLRPWHSIREGCPEQGNQQQGPQEADCMLLRGAVKGCCKAVQHKRHEEGCASVRRLAKGGLLQSVQVLSIHFVGTSRQLIQRQDIISREQRQYAQATRMLATACAGHTLRGQG